MASLQQGLRADGFEVSMVKLCRWFGVARRTVYYRAIKAPPKVQEALAAPVKAMIEAEPSFGYRTVAGLLGMNKNTVQRIFQLKGWQVRKRPIGQRPRIQALPSVASGAARTGGSAWRWLSIATPANFLAGICRAVARPARPPVPWNRP
jgi:putative transposase